MKKSYGQHFLTNKETAKKIVDQVGIVPSELIVEVGPGGGALTDWLALLPNQLVLIESDRSLSPSLTTKYPNATIIIEDAAKIDFDQLTSAPWVFISNLPYNAGTAILRQVLSAKNRPRRIVVMLQKEVGERILSGQATNGRATNGRATNGQTTNGQTTNGRDQSAHRRDQSAHQSSVLTVAVGVYATAQRLFTLKPGAFNPPPKVDSILLALTPHKLPLTENPEAVIALAKAGFANRRKQLASNLGEWSGEGKAVWVDRLARLNLRSDIRAQSLSVGEWVELSQIYSHSRVL